MVESSITSQLISSALYVASGVFLLLAGDRVTRWIKRRDYVPRALARQKIHNERTEAAIYRLEDDRGFIRTSFAIEDDD